MSDQLLTPFKAKFVLHVKTTMLQFFEDSEKVFLADKFKSSTDNIGNIDIKSVIKNNQYGSKIYREYKELYANYDEIKSLISDEKDPEMLEMMKLDLADAEVKIPALEEALKMALLPTDPNVRYRASP